MAAALLCGLAGRAGAVTSSYPPTYFAAAQPTTALDMVALLPGFSFDAGPAVRGFGGAAGNVLIDGARPASKDDSLDQVLKRIPASSVLRIEVIRGSAPGIDMQGKTVLANVVRRVGGKLKATLTAAATRAYDDRYSHLIQAEAQGRFGGIDLEGSLLTRTALDDSAGSGPKTRTDATGATILKGRELGKGLAGEDKLTAAAEGPLLGGKLRLSGSLSHNPYALTVDDQLTAPSGSEFERYTQTQDTAEIGLRYERAFGPKLQSETVLLQQLGRLRNKDAFVTTPTVSAITGDDAADVFSIRKTTGESIAREKLTWQASPALSFQGGAEGDYNALTARTTFVQNGTVVVLPAANVHVTEARGEAFGTATWAARKTLTLEAGLRLEASRIASSGDVVSAQTFSYPKPRAVITWSPTAADQIRFRFEREVGQLNFDDFAANAGNISTGEVHAGNPRLNPQRDWVFEGAYERRFWTGGDVTITARHVALQDVIDRAPIFDPAGTFDAPGNIGTGRKEELAVSLTLPTDRLGLKRGLLTGSTTFRWSRVIDPTTGAPRPISALHSNDWQAHFTQGLPRWKSTWGFDVYGQGIESYYRFSEIDTDKYKTEAIVFFEYKPRPDLSFRAQILNANGRGVEHARVVYTGPRNIDPLDYVDVRDLHIGRFVNIRVLKTFG